MPTHEMPPPRTADTSDASSRTVRRGRPEETAHLARVLARAFEDDPVSAFVLPDPATRLRSLEKLYRQIFVVDALRDQGCYTTTDHTAVALWAPAGKPRSGLAESLRLSPTMARIFGRHAPRALRTLFYLESQLPNDPHAHLTFIGTDPDRQGEGIGTLLLRQTLPRLDRERTPAYLEASTPRSRALYLRHGFVVMDQMRLPGGGPPLWRMWRDPVRA